MENRYKGSFHFCRPQTKHGDLRDHIIKVQQMACFVKMCLPHFGVQSVSLVQSGETPIHHNTFCNLEHFYLIPLPV